MDGCRHPTVGLILAGGLGRRMAGAAAEGLRGGSPPRPKPLVLLAGRPLIAHVTERLRPQVDHLVINANDPPETFAAFGLPVIADTVPGRPGPLAGVLAGLELLARDAPDARLLCVAADTPFLPPDLAERLLRRHAESGGVVCAGSAGQRHPVIALWPPSARPVLRAALEAGERKVGLLLDALGAVTESWDTANGDPFFNVNTPEELAVAGFRSPASQ